MSPNTTAALIAADLFGYTTRVRPGVGLEMETRSTAIRLDGGSVLVHSPGTLAEPDLDHIDSLGTVRHLIAPNLYHHLGLVSAMTRWPDAQVWAPTGLNAKCPALDSLPQEQLNELGDAQAENGGDAWPRDLELVEIKGMPAFREWVLWHPASATLIVTDLLFNRPAGYGWTSKLLLRLTGAARECNVSRLFRALIRDRDAFATTCREVLDLPFERIVMAHGEVIEQGAKSSAVRALSRWTN